MRSAWLWLALAVALALDLVACNRSTPGSGSGSESGGNTAATPRIVTLSPSATETVAALGASAFLVGVDQYSDWPADVVAKLPKVGSFVAPDLEAIVRLRPTLVIVDDVHSQQAATLHDRDIETVECAMHALPDVKAALRTVGAKLGRASEADKAIAAIDKALDDAAAKKPAKHPRVLAVIDREAGGLGKIIAAGPGSLVDELLAVLGADNALASAGSRYPAISAEEVLRTQPDVVVDLSYAAKDGITEWLALKIPAAESKRIKALSSTVLSHPSPRVAEQLDLLAGAIR